MSFLLLYEYVTCFRFVFITITPCLHIVIIIIIIIIVIIINIIIAKEQGGSLIEYSNVRYLSWRNAEPKMHCFQFSFQPVDLLLSLKLLLAITLIAECRNRGFLASFKGGLNRVFHMTSRWPYWCPNSNETAAMLVSQTSPFGVKLFSYAHISFCFNKLA